MISPLKNIALNGFSRNNQNKRQVAFTSRRNNFGDEKSITVNGKATKAKIYTQNVDYSTIAQIKLFCDHPVFRDVPIRVMPDTHSGVNSVVGFSAPVTPENKVIPNILGGDIGCGMLCVEIDTNGKEPDFKKLDEVIRSSVSTKRKELPDVSKTADIAFQKKVFELTRKYKTSSSEVMTSFATLGGGNHFIELDKSSGKYYLVIHSGSRKFGKDVASYYADTAQKQNPYKIKGLSYLSGSEAKDYLADLKFAVEFSKRNRRAIADEIIKKMGWSEVSSFESIHNYIADDGIIRKGAIRADKGQRMIIPLNKRDGALLASGKGNPDWNNTAPHGAGRQYRRSEAKDHISYEEYLKSMEGIYTTCVSPSTIDESPQAYKDSCEIIENIEDTAEVEDIISPVFNYKD